MGFSKDVHFHAKLCDVIFQVVVFITKKPQKVSVFPPDSKIVENLLYVRCDGNRIFMKANKYPKKTVVEVWASLGDLI